MTWSALKTTCLGSLIVLIQFVLGTSSSCDGFQSRIDQVNSNQLNSSRVNSFRVTSASKTISTRLTRFNVPFRINQPDDSFVEVQLYLSRDGGQSWQFYGRQKTDSQSFPFVADGDGVYWFAVKTLDRNRQLLPDGKITQAELKVNVDTEMPKLEAQVKSDAAGRVVCYWRAEDDHLLVDSVRILYQENVEGIAATDNWIKVPVNLKPQVSGRIYTDQLGWWPETSVPYLNVRIEIADSAGNIARADRSIVVKQVAALRNNQSTAVRLPQQPPAQPIKSVLPQVAGQTPPSVAAESNRTAADDVPGMICQDGVCRPVTDDQSGQGQYLKKVQSSVNQLDHNPYKLVGSPSEFALPPVPDQFTGHGKVDMPIQSTRPNTLPGDLKQSSHLQQASVPWPSESQTAAAQPDQVDGSTTDWNSHPSVPSAQQPLVDYTPLQRNTALVEPTQSKGESFVRQQGDMIVSQSTTMGRGKQFPIENNPLAQDGSHSNAASVRSVTPAVSRLSNPVSRPNYETGSRVSNPPTVDPVKDRAELSVTESDLFRQSISNTRFQLQYGVQSIDPSGVSRVVLWMTRDGGRSWSSWATDEDLVSPMPVQVQEQGTYGFQIVVHSKDGLTGRAPAPGDRPDIVVDVDTTRPSVQFVSAPYGRGPSAGKMVINWQVEDEHLTIRPIRLLYSTTPAGPWTVIEEGLPNRGTYVWAVDKRAPSQVYLRIEARDRAGNLGAHQLPTPIDLSGLVPRGKILGLQRIDSNQ